MDPHLLAWTLIPGIGARRFRALMESLGPGEMADLWARPGELIETVQQMAHQVPPDPPGQYLREAETILKRCREEGIHLLIWGQETYPPALQGIADPPPVLYVRGNLQSLSTRSIAVVGTRKPSGYGRTQARRFARAFAEAGLGVISGGARGIDTEAHLGALEAGGLTLAVLGSGVNVAYPRTNRKLFQRIVDQQGALVSEFPPDTTPIPEHFPRRNRLISGLSVGVLVIEGREKSGALNTAFWAADQGRDVWALPGPVTSVTSEGPHFLLRNGARAVHAPEDLLTDLTLPFLGETERVQVLPPLTAEEERVLRLLTADEPCHLDALAEAHQADPFTLLPLLLSLELKGRVRQLPGKYFIRIL